MNKIVSILFFINVSYSSIPLVGNDFLKEYPFDKIEDEMSDEESSKYIFYNGYFEGWIGGNQWIVNNGGKDIIKGITVKKLSILLKEYLDDNPTKKYRELSLLVGDVLLEQLPKH